jgi:hypothetical protein
MGFSLRFFNEQESIFAHCSLPIVHCTVPCKQPAKDISYNSFPSNKSTFTEKEAVTKTPEK